MRVRCDTGFDTLSCTCRERAAGYYATYPFALAQVVVELPYLIVQDSPLLVYHVSIGSYLHVPCTSRKRWPGTPLKPRMLSFLSLPVIAACVQHEQQGIVELY